MSSEKFNISYKKVSDVVECVLDTQKSSLKDQIRNIIISLMITMRLLNLDDQNVSEKMRQKIKEHDPKEKVEMESLFIHDSLVNSITLDYVRKCIIPFIVRVDLKYIRVPILFNTIIHFFERIDNGRSESFDSFRNLVNMNRTHYLGYLENVSKGGKVLIGAITSNFVATSTADESDLRLFLDGWSVKEKSELGLYLINNGNRMRSQKGTYEITVKNEKGGDRKLVLVKFPRESEEITKLDFTYPRALIVTARSVAQTCCQLNEEGGIRMFELALNIGWHGLFLKAHVDKLAKVFLKNNCPTVTEEKLYLCAIPRIRPHAYLDMDMTEKYLMIIFYILNDIIISLKSGKDRFDFTSATLSKMKKIQFSPVSKILKKSFAAVWNITRHYRDPKVQIGSPQDIVQFVKRILVAEREGHF